MFLINRDYFSVINSKFRYLNVTVLCAVVLTSLNLRAAVTSLTDIYAFVEKDITGFNTSVMGMLPLLCFAFFGLIAPKLQKKFGFEKVLCGAMLLAGISLLIRCYATHFIVFVFCSTLAFAGMALGNVLIPSLFKKYFPNQIGMITSVYSVVVAFSAGMPSFLSSDLTPVYGWRVSLGLWGVVALLAVIPWVIQIFAHPELVKADAKKAQAKQGLNHNNVMRWKTSWMIAMLFGVGGMLPMYTMINWLPEYLVHRGISIQHAGTMLFLYNALGIVHSFLVPLVLSKMKRPFILIIIAVALQITGYLGFLYFINYAWLWSIVAAPGLLTVPVTFQLFNMRSKTTNGAAHLSSFVQFFGYLIAVIGPLGFALLLAKTHSFILSFWLMILFSLLTLYFGKESLKDGFIEDC